jgi:hypothetical protein
VQSGIMSIGDRIERGRLTTTRGTTLQASDV